MGPDLLHLPKAFPLPPLGPAVLEPDLQDESAKGQATRRPCPRAAFPESPPVVGHVLGSQNHRQT